jgi:hypothetical protein
MHFAPAAPQITIDNGNMVRIYRERAIQWLCQPHVPTLMTETEAV